MIKREMETLKLQGGERDWNKWKQLKVGLELAYKNEEEYWCRKSRNNWLREGDRNTSYFHAVTAERRKRNRLEKLQNREGNECLNEEEMAEEIALFFASLFTSSNPDDRVDVFEGIQKTITENMNRKITRPVEDLEIKKCPVFNEATLSTWTGRRSFQLVETGCITRNLFRDANQCERTYGDSLFADDSLLFCKAEVAQIRCISDLLKRYEAVSGQKINLEKSSVLFSKNTQKQIRREICEILQGVTEHARSSYLGLPMVIERSKK